MNIVFLGIALASKMFSALRVKPGRQNRFYTKRTGRKIAPDAGKYSCMSDWDRSVPPGHLLAAREFETGAQSKGHQSSVCKTSTVRGQKMMAMMHRPSRWL